MQLNREYNVGIIGGGLAGLAAAIQLSRQSHSVALFEKEKYPFHKVCGEYISLESWDFLKQLGLPLDALQLPKIDTLFLSAPNGKYFTTKLPLGGFGISRYKLDTMLAGIARANGVHVADETRVDQVEFNEGFKISCQSKANIQNRISTKVCCAAYGKRSNLDVKWNRKFLQSQDKRLDNYVAVKYHIQTDWQKNVIGLHNFENGYCGISRIEDDKYCLCYMTNASNLKSSGNNIKQLEQEILCKNPHLKNIFNSSVICDQFPVTISQINFNRKTIVQDHVLMLGDAAGMITPLCGNGMSIALHTSKISAVLIHDFLTGKISRSQMENSYQHQWEHHFSKRLKTGRMLQRFFGSSLLSNAFVQTFKILPFLAKPVVKMTHGKPF
jgi:flavin-dependent dehydrogenase